MAITTKTVTGLNDSTTYYFNVLVKDTAGNEAAYTKKMQDTLDATLPVPGNSGTITASAVGETTVTLNWTKATDNISSQASLQYLAYKSTNSTLSSVSEIENNGVAVGDYEANINTKVVSLASAGTTYYFNVIVKDEAGNKAPYTKLTQATADTTSPTIANATLTPTSVTSTQVILTWNKATDNVNSQPDLQYRAFYSTNANLSSVSEIENNGTGVGDYAYDIATKTISGLTAGTNYYFNVLVKDLAGNKAPYTKLPVSLDIVNPIPGGGGAVVIPVETAKANEVIINWTKATDDLTIQAALQYLVYYSTNSAMDTLNEVKANGTAFGSYVADINTKTVTGLLAGTDYYFNVVVKDNSGLLLGGPGNETVYGKQHYLTPTLDVSIASTVPDTGTTILSLVPFTVTFIEGGYPVDDATFIEADITVTNGAVDTGSLTGTGTAWSFDVVPTLAGDVTVQIEAAKVQDTNANNNTASNLWTFTYVTAIDIKRLSRFISGLPRDVDVETNTLQLQSLKVGTTTPATLTKAMAELLVTTYTPGLGLPGDKVSAGAKQDILERKLVALHTPVLDWEPTTGNTSDVVTTEVLAAAAVDIPVSDGEAISEATAWGIFVGTVSGASDVGKVLIRVKGTDNGIEDGNGDEIYGVLSESSGVYTLSYKTSAGSPYTILAADTTAKMDFYFVEVTDLYSFGVDRLLTPAIGGVIDTTLSSLTEDETTARMNADSTLQANLNIEITARRVADNAEITARRNADSSIQGVLDVETTSRMNADSTIQAAIDDEATARANADSTLQAAIDDATARANADSTLQAAIDDEATARADADSTIQAAIDDEATARADADSTLQANLNAEKTSRLGADSTLQAAIDGEATARADADSTLQANLDAEKTSRLDADSTLQANLDAEKTSRLDADSTLQGQIDVIVAADSTLQANLNSEITSRLNADSTLQANLNSEITSRSNADSTLQANLNSEITSRRNSDSTLQVNLDNEITSRLNADSTLQSNIDGASRANADSTLQANLDLETTSRLDADSTLQANLDGEITSRLNADSTLQGNIDAEATARLNSDSTLQANLDGEITSRLNSDSTLQGNIDGEATARLNSDSTLQANIDAEITSRLGGDSTLTTNLNTEQTSRLNSDSTLQANIDSEITSRVNADSTLQANIDAETTARLNADSTLQTQINNIDVAVVDVPFVVATGGVTAGDVVIESLTVAGECTKANATGIATCETVLGVALATKTAGQTVMVRTYGEATVTTDGTNFDLGKRVYAHTTAGQASKTAPSTVNNVVYLLGNATATNKVVVNPNLEYVVEN